MRTKTLLLTAALVAATSASALAQVYSVNAVGYVNITIPGQGLAIIANPLNGTNNDVNTILPLPDGSDGATIYRYDPVAGAYKDSMTFVTGLGWLTSDPDPTLNPGEGFWLYNNNPTPLNITFVGEVPQNHQVNPIPGNNVLALRSSIIPQEGALGDAANTNTLRFPADNGDSVYVYDTAAGTYKDSYTYIEGLGWLGPDGGDTGPVIRVAQGFWIWKQAPGKDWVRDFSVN